MPALASYLVGFVRCVRSVVLDSSENLGQPGTVQDADAGSPVNKWLENQKLNNCQAYGGV